MDFLKEHKVLVLTVVAIIAVAWGIDTDTLREVFNLTGVAGSE